MDKNKNDDLWTNHQMTSKDEKYQTGINQLSDPPTLTAVGGQKSPSDFFWEENLPLKETPQGELVVEAPLKIADFTPQKIEPKKKEEVEEKIKPGTFIIAERGFSEPKTQPSSQPPVKPTPKQKKALNKGLMIFSIAGFFLLVVFVAGGFFIWQHFGQQLKTINQPLGISLPVRISPIQRIIPGYGSNVPSILPIEETFDLEKYSDPSNKFTIEKPKDWLTEVKDEKTTVFSKKTPDKDYLGFQYNPQVEIVQVAKEGSSLKDYFEKVKNEVSSGGKNQIVGENNVSEKDFEALSFEAKTKQGDLSLHLSKLLIGYKDNFYSITASSIEEKWDSYRNLFNEVLTSFSPMEAS